MNAIQPLHENGSKTRTDQTGKGMTQAKSLKRKVRAVNKGKTKVVGYESSIIDNRCLFNDRKLSHLKMNLQEHERYLLYEVDFFFLSFFFFFSFCKGSPKELGVSWYSPMYFKGLVTQFTHMRLLGDK